MEPDRLHALDAVRAFALLIGIAYHACFSFFPGMVPGEYATIDSSPSDALGTFAFIVHIFRMSLFFFIAGFFARMLFHRGGPRAFWVNRLKRILVPLVVGWIVLIPVLDVVWGWGLARTFDTPLNLPFELAPMRGEFPLLHLWFLYYLLLLYVAVLVLRSALLIVDRVGHVRALADRLARCSLDGYWAAFVVGLPIAICFYAREGWSFSGGIPTPNFTLIPRLITVDEFGTAMAFGWLVHRQASLLLAVLERRWIGNFVIAVASTAVCLWIMDSASIAQAFEFRT